MPNSTYTQQAGRQAGSTLHPLHMVAHKAML